jgi:ketosteroid isomerase-like protein
MPGPLSAADVVRRFYELATVGDRACWELWSEDAVSVAPPQWPEGGQVTGIEDVSRTFEEWREAFGHGWYRGIRLEDLQETGDGRVLADVAFHFEGESSGVPVSDAVAAIYTVEDGKIVRAEHFTDRAAARAAAGIE